MSGSIGWLGITKAPTAARLPPENSPSTTCWSGQQAGPRGAEHVRPCGLAIQQESTSQLQKH